MPRKATSPTVELKVLLKSRRRCALCVGLHRDLEVKRGQIAHIDRNAQHCSVDNLAFLCLAHHDEYDSKTSQSKGITSQELKQYRDQLYEDLESEEQFSWPDSPSAQHEKGPPESLVPNSLYDQQIAVYRVVREFLGEIYRRATITREQLARYNHGIDEALFLFRSNEFTAYLTELANKAIRLMHTHERLEIRPCRSVSGAPILQKRMHTYSSGFRSSLRLFGRNSMNRFWESPSRILGAVLSESSQIGTQTTYRSFQILSA